MGRKERRQTVLQEALAYIAPAEKALCPLCGRELAPPANKHHLLPVSRGGRGTQTVILHKICHDKIHSVIKESELERHYNTIAQLQQQPELARFIEWVQTKPPDFYDGSRRQKEGSAWKAKPKRNK